MKPYDPTANPRPLDRVYDPRWWMLEIHYEVIPRMERIHRKEILDDGHIWGGCETTSLAEPDESDWLYRSEVTAGPTVVSAMGHTFRPEDLRCHRCPTTWEEH